MPERKVLVVDNSPVILKILVAILQGQGCEVQTASNGLAALDVLSCFQPDIIVTDLVMPKIDGHKLSFIVRNTPKYRDIFLIVLTGIAMEDDVPGSNLGADVCIAKGPAVEMKKHILAALTRFDNGQRGDSRQVEGLSGLHAREVTAELLLGKRHNDIILASMAEGVVELNHQGRVVLANEAVLRLFSSPEEQVLGRSLVDFLPEKWGKRVEAWIGGLATGEEWLSFTSENEDPLVIGNRQVTLHLTPVPEEGQFFLIGMLQDVTRAREIEEEKRKLEEKLHNIRKFDAMAIMASGISHDFNNLLTVINGNVEMAMIHAPNGKVRALLDEAGKALHLTNTLIRKFTTFSDTYLPMPAHVEIFRLIDEQLEQDFFGSGIDYTLQSADDLLSVQVDSKLLRQVFHNLFQNAIEACRNGGDVRVYLDNVEGLEEASRTGQLLADSYFVRVRVHDSGAGIAKEIQGNIFDPYFSTKQKGSQKGMGLGLTIVHAVVAKHGGLVSLESDAGNGCTVSLYLPAALRAPAVSAEERGRKPLGRILIMDDDEMMQLVYKKMCAHFNCTFAIAEDGASAVTMYQEEQSKGEGFDLVWLDVDVTGSMGGMETARKIHALDPDALLVAVSGETANDVLRNSVSAQFRDTLTKPFSLDAIERILDRFLG